MSRRIVKPVKRGGQIKNLEDLHAAAQLKECVITSFNVMMPAVWVYQMQGQLIMEFIRGGLYIYKGLRK